MTWTDPATIKVNPGDVGLASDWNLVMDDLTYLMATMPPLETIGYQYIVNTTVETTVAQWVIPANALGTHGFLRVAGAVYFACGNYQYEIHTVRFKFGATPLLTYAGPNISYGATCMEAFDFYLINAGATNAQIALCGYTEKTSPGSAMDSGGAGGGRNTASEGTTTEKTLTVTIQHPTAAADQFSQSIWALYGPYTKEE